MKTKIFFACLVFCFACQVKAQIEFAPIGAEWHYNCCAGGNIKYSHLNHILSEKDTIVEKNSCRVLKQYYDNSNIESGKYILKQNKGKIYYYYQNQFNLLFDFDAEVNDIVEFTFMYRKYDEVFPLPFYKDTILSARYQVESITTDTQNLKMFATKILEEDKFTDDYGKEILPWYYSYTENIGYYYEFMPMLDNLEYPTIDNFPMLRCYSDADISFTSDSWFATYLPCNYSIATNINSPQNENIKIYPNPFNDNISVSIKNEGMVRIIDISGKIIFHSKLLNGVNKISTNHFPKGIFFVEIQCEDNNNIQTFKIVKL